MHCNQPFCGNGFTNGPFYSTPLHSTQQSIYPEIVGEGEVTSVTLPDGSVQFFFMPTIKWWSPPNPTPCQPYPAIANPMFANTNSIPAYNNNAGTWFIRRISDTLSPNVFNAPCQRNELPRNLNNTACNMSTHEFGYPVKFHNDGWTSTTDLVYFYPNLRQRDFVFAPPCKDETVQIDTEPAANIIPCHHDLVCSKPCLCCAGEKPMSQESLVDTDMICKCKKATKEAIYSGCPFKNNNKRDKEKPMSQESLVDTEMICKCNKATKEAIHCGCPIQNNNKRDKEKKNKRNKSKIICDCDSTANVDSTADKSVATVADKGNDCNPADGCETQTGGLPEESQCCMNVQPIVNKSIMKQNVRYSKSYSSCSTTDECSCDDRKSNKKLKRPKHVKYKLQISKKCDCGCESTTSTVSGNETTTTMGACSQADGCQTELSTVTKCDYENDAQDSPSVKNTDILQWFNDDVFQLCEQTSASNSLSSKTVVEGKSSENFCNNSNAGDSNCATSYG